MIPLPPTQTYSADNEAQFRRQTAAADAENMKPNQGVSSFIMLDATTQAPYKVTMVAGVLTVTAL